MNGPLARLLPKCRAQGDEFLAGPAFAGDQDVDGSKILESFHLFDDAIDRSASSDQAGDSPAFGLAIAEAGKLFVGGLQRRFPPMPGAAFLREVFRSMPPNPSERRSSSAFFSRNAQSQL